MGQPMGTMCEQWPGPGAAGRGPFNKRHLYRTAGLAGRKANIIINWFRMCIAPILALSNSIHANSGAGDNNQQRERLK